MTGVPDYALRAITRLEEAGYEAYLVGGCVRDLLMGRPPKDIDIATDARPEQVMAVFERTAPTGLKYGTVTVLLGNGRAEVTTYRVDGDYTDRRRPDSVAFSDSLREDLSRRDFTAGAMAWNLKSGLFDPFHGQADLEKRLIRCVGEPERRYGEDALRILRGWRFCAQLGFEMEGETRRAARRLAHTLSAVSAERVREELLRILESPEPDRVWQAAADGCFSHLGLSCPPEPIPLGPVPPELRLMALLWQAGRGREADILRALRLDGDTRRGTMGALIAMELPPVSDEAALRLRLMEHGERAVTDGLSLRGSLLGEDTAASEAAVRRILSRGDCLSVRDLRVGGGDLMAMGLPPGPRLGELLRKLLLLCIEDPAKNDRETLLRLAEDLMKSG